MGADDPKGDLAAGSIYCVISDERRYGYLIVQRFALNRQGDLDAITLNFLLWKNATDR